MIRAIAAVDKELGIGKDGTIPWNLPTDAQYFTDMTKKYGGNVLTGERTFRLTYVHGPLSGRNNYIVTADTEPIPGAHVVNDLQGFLDGFTDDLWISGGANVFEQTLDKTDELYITHIDGVFGCDRFFPQFEDKFELVEKQAPITENGFIFYYATYRRK